MIRPEQTTPVVAHPGVARPLTPIQRVTFTPRHSWNLRVICTVHWWDVYGGCAGSNGMERDGNRFVAECPDCSSEGISRLRQECESTAINAHRNCTYDCDYREGDFPSTISLVRPGSKPTTVWRRPILPRERRLRQ